MLYLLPIMTYLLLYHVLGLSPSTNISTNISSFNVVD